MMDIDSMPAGREMDALVAEKVMGCRVVNGACRCEEVPAHYLAAFTPFPFKHGYEGNPIIKHYSTDISAAWGVVERFNYTNKINGHCWLVQCLCRISANTFPYLFQCTINNGIYPEKSDHAIWFHGWGKAMPEAICRAALKAVL